MLWVDIWSQFSVSLCWLPSNLKAMTRLYKKNKIKIIIIVLLYQQSNIFIFGLNKGDLGMSYANFQNVTQQYTESQPLNWSFVLRTGLTGGSMAASRPRILSLEHSENTCSWRGTWGSRSSVSLTTSDSGDWTAPGPDSEAENGNKHKKLTAKG